VPPTGNDRSDERCWHRIHEFAGRPVSDIKDFAPLIMAALATTGAIAGALRSAWRFAKAQAVAELLRDQSAATILAKNKELTDLDAENGELKAEKADLKAENGRLWALLQEKSR